MHQEAADKLSAAEGDLSFWVTGFLSPCRENHFCFCNREDPIV